MSLEAVTLERGRGEPSGSDVIGTRAGSDGMLAGLPDTGGEIVTLRVWCAVPVHDELTTKLWVSVDHLINMEKKAYSTVLNGFFVSFPISFVQRWISRKKGLSVHLQALSKIELDSRPLSLPGLLLLLNTTTYHSRSWSSGSFNESQLKLSTYG